MQGERPWSFWKIFLAVMAGVVVLGVIAGTALTGWLSVRGFTMPGMEEMAAQFNLPARIYPEVTALTAFVGPLVVFIFTLLAAVYPAWRLRRLHPVEAMRTN